MNKFPRTAISLALASVLSLAMLSACNKAAAQTSAATPADTTAAASPAATAPLTAAEAEKIGVEGVVYGMPLVIMDLTKQVSTNVAGPQPDAHAPINQFGNMAAYPPASDHSVVRMNVDTLYSWGWLDLSDGPVVVTVPDTDGRYYLMPLVDAWTNVFASPGKRTTGTKAGNFVITGPGWKGDTPEGMEVYKSPTNMVWTLGRTQANGPKDYPTVHKIQAGYKITPLSAWGKPYTPPAGVVDPKAEHGSAGQAARSHEHDRILQRPDATDGEESRPGGRCAGAEEARHDRRGSRREIRPFQARSGHRQSA